MADLGFLQAAGIPVPTPLPVSWLGRADAPFSLPSWATIDLLSADQNRNLLSQIGYDKSTWNYKLIGPQNQLGRYQFSTQVLENYGLLAPGSNKAYGTACVNYQTCWRPVTIRNTNSYANYIYNITSLNGFLNSPASQDHLAYQILYDTYRSLLSVSAITNADSTDIVAGMLYVGWDLGAGATPTYDNPTGTGAYAWRYSGQGIGVNSFNSGRYSIVMLGQ